jgi:hypothetical protein
MRSLLLLAALSILSTSLGCVASADTGDEGESERDTESLTPGVNGGACTASPYNCKLRVDGGNRVETNDPKDANVWHLITGVPVRDGNGTIVATSTIGGTTFNYGQTRTFAGQTYALAVSTSNGSAGWMPVSSILGHDSFLTKVGHVVAHESGLAKMGCYEIRDASDPSIEMKKVVYDSNEGPDGHERAGDYLPLVRNDGRRSANLAFNVPGFGLGGVAIDHFPAGTRFQRLDVPTHAGPPSIDIPLWVQDSVGRYRKQSGTMKFVYGTIVAADGTRRVGWMAYEALTPSSGCR